MSNNENVENRKPNGNPLSSFAWSPPNVFFATQETQEKIVLLMPCHWTTNTGWVVLSLFLAVFPFIFFVFLGDFFSLDIWNNSYFSIKLTLLFAWYLLVFGFIFTKFLNWYFNVYIVTNKRVMDIDFKGMLYRNISEAELSRVQDITHTQVGSTAVLFNYGEIKIQTAAQYSDIEFGKVPNPSEIHKIIGQIIEKAREN